MLHRKRNEEGVGIERVKRQEIQSLKMTLPDVTTPDTSQASYHLSSLMALLFSGCMLSAHHVPALNFNYPAHMKFETVVAGAVEVIEHLPRT